MTFLTTQFGKPCRDTEHWMRNERDISATLPARLLMMNLSSRLRLFHRAFRSLERAEPDVLSLEQGADAVVAPPQRGKSKRVRSQSRNRKGKA